MAGDRGLQLDMFGGVDESATVGTSTPMMITGGGWQMAETAAFVAALRRGSLNDALGVINRLKVDTAWKVLLEAGFTVGSSNDRKTLMAPVQKDIIEAAQRGLTGHELRAAREQEVAAKPPALEGEVLTASDVGQQEYRDAMEVIREIASGNFAARMSSPTVVNEVVGEGLHRHVPMTEPKVLYRSVSALEWEQIQKDGVIRGGLNTFNGGDPRREVFFGDKLDAQLIGQGEDRTRQVEYLLQDGPQAKSYRDLRNALALVEQDLAAQASIKGYPILEEVPLFIRSSDPAMRASLAKRHSLEDQIDEVQASYNAASKAKAVELKAADEKRGFSSVVLETRPITGGRAYLEANGHSMLPGGNEYGFDSAAVKMTDIAQVHYVMRKQIIERPMEIVRDADAGKPGAKVISDVSGRANRTAGKLPNMVPANYKTLDGLLSAAERVLVSGATNIAGQSRGMWLHNAEWVAQNSFQSGEAVRKLREKYSITRRQDLSAADAGDAVFGIPLPQRGYIIGDNVPGVGEIVDEVESPHGKQFLIDGQWYNEQVLDPAAKSRAAAEVRSIGDSPTRPSEDVGTSRSNTDDAGAELTYNKRNRIKTGIRWNDIESMEPALRVRETVKAKVYPKPDYQALIDGGMQPLHAHLVKQVYDSLAAKPATKAPNDEQLQVYIDGMNRVMTGVIEWAKAPDGAANWTGMRGDGERLLKSLYPDGWKAKATEVGLLGGNKMYGALQPGSVEKQRAEKAIKEGWPEARESWEKQGFQVLHAEELRPLFYAATNRAGMNYVTVHFSVGGKRVGGHVFVDNAESENHPAVLAAVQAKRKLWQGKHLVLNKRNEVISGHESEEEALGGARAAVKRGTDKGISEVGIQVESAERKGPERRAAGENVSTEKLIETFGFKGVNFGTWMKGKSNEAERQLHVNHIYDAFMDLSDILNVPPKALSLNGMLGVAVGAQGNGKFAAHFVPGVNEINLTRTSGAGSLAHEWGHALDHYFARLSGLERDANPFLTEHATFRPEMERMEMIEGKYQRVVKPRFGEDLRPEVLTRFKSIVETMKKRPITQEESDQRQTEHLARTEKGVEGWLKSVRRDFENLRGASGVLGAATVMRSGQPVAVVQAFDDLAARVRTLDLGEGVVMAGKSRVVSPVVNEMRELYKEVTGRLYSLDDTLSLQSNIDALKYAKTASDEARSHVQQVTTDYVTEAAKLDKGKQKPYWSTPVELFARAFDAYVSDCLEARAQMNSYLSHAGRMNETTPMGEERKTINAAFDALVGEVKSRETEQGVALFSLGGATTKGLNVDAVAGEVQRLRERWPQMPGVTVVRTVGELPFAAPGNADGALWQGKIFVVAENLRNREQLQKVVAHECVMHFGLEEMLGKKVFGEVCDHIQMLKLKGDPTVVGLANEVRQAYGPLPVQEQSAEIIARAGERCLDKEGNIKVEFGWMKGVFAGVAGWLRKVGIEVPFSNTELQGLIHKAEKWMGRDDGNRAAEAGNLQPVFSTAGAGAPRDQENIETAARRLGRFVDALENRQIRPTDTQVLGPTPTVLQALGADSLPLQIDGETLLKIRNGKHRYDMSSEALRGLAEGLYNPLMVFDSPDTRTGAPGKLLVTESVDRLGNPVVALVHLSKRADRMIVNDVASAYGLENLETRSKVSPEKLQYVRNEKGLASSTTPNLLKLAGVVQKARDLGVTVLSETDVVNKFGPQFSIADTSNRHPFGDAVLAKQGIHVGPVIDVKNGYVLQDSGRGRLVVHEIGRTAIDVGKGQVLNVAYGRDGAMKVNGKAEPGKGIER